MKCLIVAAGQGARLREKLELKPLVPLRGVPLIMHVINRARLAGIDDFVVVSGYRGDELRRALDEFAAQEEIGIVHAINDDWGRANGVSLLKAKPVLGEPFVLTMCDHLLDPGILAGLMAQSGTQEGVVLGVDYNIGNFLIDPDDVTKVRCSNGRIEQIGKLIADFNCFDTGAFLCTPLMFEALEESQAHGDDSISGAMTVLARWRPH
jgi:1L-myo-inositol 1-phosphate cytidylyltransferase